MDHTEALLVEFDPIEITYEDLVLEWSRMHYPRGKTKCQYRSAVWYLNEEQREIAEHVVEGMKIYMGRHSTSPSVVRAIQEEEEFSSVEEATRFFRAEEYHQNFTNKQRF
mmetsp:Transcript_1093/g.1431  ORF Transcript_1093/g.1431 Transcript_1093/m.1431 type:complete len:110 (+) Transcript_1093:325-654(+)